jgi:hypothetical protein
MWQIMDAKLVVTRVVLRLLRRLTSPQEVQGVVELALPEIKPLYSKFELITIVEYQEMLAIS